MSVLIKGMEIPKSCDYCDFFEPYRESIGYCGIIKSQIPCDCPLVPVPPHGDLIDRDAYQYSGDLMDEPVIIPAEGVEK